MFTVNKVYFVQKEVYNLKKYFTKTTDAKFTSCVRMESKSLTSSDLNHPPGAHAIILSAKGSCVTNGGKHTGESFLRAGIRHDVSVKCATNFGHVMERIRQPGSLSTTDTSVGRAGLSIWHLPRHTWGLHRVLLRCENNFESSPFSLYIARRSSTFKIIF
jgi:hypothetical protein